MDISQSVVCSHCNTRVYKQWLVDHVREELQDRSTSSSSQPSCTPCSNILQTMMGLLCALHQYGHQKTPVIHITCSWCSFETDDAEKFAEHLQMKCGGEDSFSPEGVGGVREDAVAAHVLVYTSADEGSSFTFRASGQPNNGEEDNGDEGRCEETVGTTSLQGEKSAGQTVDWDGQRFQHMMSMLLTDTPAKGRSRKNSEEGGGQNSKEVSVQGNQWEEATVSQQVKMICEESEGQTSSSQILQRKSTVNQQQLVVVDCTQASNVRGDCNEDDDGFVANRKTNKTKKVKRSKAEHQQLKALFMCPLCGYSGRKKEDLESHMVLSHGKVEYKCSSCNFVAKSQRNLYRHQLRHQKMHGCRYCDFTTRWRKSLMMHEKRHTGEGMIKCDLCDYVTPDKDSLLKHQVKHTGEKPFVCGQCNKAFARKCEVKRHELRHAGIKTAMCHICGDTFYRNYELLHHIQAKHDGLKLCKCDQCPFETAYFPSLLTHRRAYHTGEKPFKCEFEGCNYSSASKSQLNVHRRKHTGERPFKCTMCSYASADNAGLRKHVRKHSNLRPYKCNVCSFDTKHSFLLRKHMETAHNVMSNCKISQHQLASIVTTGNESLRNDVPAKVFNQDLYNMGNNEYVHNEIHHQPTTTNIETQVEEC